MRGIPTSKATQSANIIREAIHRGEWAHYIPGERALAKDLMVSRACLRQALEILTEEKLLAPVQRSKRRAILRKDSDSDQGVSKVIFLSPAPPHRATPMALEQFAQLRHHLAKDDRPLEFISTPAYNQPQVSDESMCQLTNEHPGAHWVLHQCPEHLQKWFAGQSIRATLLGSPFSGIDLPSIDIDFRSASRHATGSLLSLGHRRLCLIRFRSHLAGDDLALNGIADALAHHHDCPAPIVLSQNFHVDNLTSMLDRLYARPTPPTGIIVVNHHHFITAYSHLLSKGIQIPNQVSIVCLTHDTLMDRLSPRPTTYSVGDRLIKKLAQMVLNPSSTNQGSRIQLIPEMQAGKTICRHSASTNE